MNISFEYEVKSTEKDKIKALIEEFYEACCPVEKTLIINNS